MFRSINKETTEPVLYGVAMLGSLVIAYWSHLIDPIINKDGIIYVLTGEAFLHGNIASGLDGYKWPFYPMSVACLSWITGLSVETSALMFNAFMRGIGGIAFLVLTQRLGANRNQLVLAVLVYLFCPALNELQSKIIRDFAFLACFLWMIVFFVGILDRSSLSGWVLFVVTGLLATAYRIEGMLYFVGLLLYYLIWGKRRVFPREVRYTAALVTLSVIIYAGGMWITNGDIMKTWEVLAGRFDRAVLELEETLVQMEPGFWKAMANGLKLPIALSMPLVRLFWSLVEVISLGYLIILAACLFVRPVLANGTSGLPMYGVWKWVVALNLSMLIVYSVVIRIFNDRYPISLALMLILFIPFVLTRVHEIARDAGRVGGRAVIGVLGILLIINSVEGLDRFTVKQYLREAGSWITEESENRYTNKLYTNDRILDYYAGNRVVKNRRHYSARSVSRYIENDGWKELDFLALKTGKDISPERIRRFQNRTGHTPKRVFENGKGGQVLIYDFREVAEK